MEKERRTKALVVVVLLIVVAGLTVAFAALSTTLNINGTAYLDAAKWGIKFENLSDPVKVGTATVTGTAKIEESKSAEITGINVSLSTPGDKVTYTVDLVNEGTINAKIDKIEKTELTSEQQKYLTFKITDKDGKEVSEGDILSASETRNLTITIEFIKDLTKEDLPTSTSTISLSYKLNFVQTDEKVTSAGQGVQQACTSFDKKDTYNVGDVIALCNTTTNKSEDFYVIKDNGDTVKALAKYNLLVGNRFNYKEDFSDFGINNSPSEISESEQDYGLQSSSASFEIDTNKGTPTVTNTVGTISFSNGSSYWSDSKNNGSLLSKYGTAYSADVFDSNSTLYAPLENYKNYLRNALKKTSTSVDLLSYNEALSLGCVITDQENRTGNCKSAPSWVYSTDYWTSTAIDSSYIWTIYNIPDMSFGFGDYRTNYLFGLRPVITISKSEL